MEENSSSSSSESDGMSDVAEFSSDEEDLFYENRLKPKNSHYFEVTVQAYNNEEFMEHFRVSWEIYTLIVEHFVQSPYYHHHSGGNGKLTGDKQIAIFLWFAGHQTASFRDVADRFNISISTLYTIIRRVTYFLSNLSPSVIRWPSEEEKVEIESSFREKGFPGVIGVIDGTHIMVDKPTLDPDSYYNRKHVYSLHAQLVCDHKRKIRDVFIGYPGSVHDSRVLRTSIGPTLPQKCGLWYLLGDSGYPCLPNLLTPYKDRGNLTQRQRNYNTQLAKVRYIIEHCNGLLKQKWRQLFHLKLRSIKDMTHFIRACCVLHNLTLEDEYLFELDLQDGQAEEAFQDGEENEIDDRNGVNVRDHVATILNV